MPPAPEPGAATTSPEEYRLLRQLLEGTAEAIGADFLRRLVLHMREALGCRGAWVTEWIPEGRRLRALAFRLDDRWVEDYEYAIANTPCEPVIEECRLVFIPERVVELYPGDNDLVPLGAVSYMGIPLLDVDGRLLGHLSVLDSKPMAPEPSMLAVFRIFAARAAAELQRQRATARLAEREERLRRLTDGAMDAILELDAELRVVQANPAAVRLFGGGAGRGLAEHGLAGCVLGEIVEPASLDVVRRLASTMTAAAPADGRAAQWIAGGLHARTVDGVRHFPAEASIARTCATDCGDCSFILVLRDVNDREEAERAIRALTERTRLLSEELERFAGTGEIVGSSDAMRRVLGDIAQVAPTPTTVLITGETGTGKELVARAVHANSPRRDRPLVVVNCAAIPATLVESELFGHEKGAFTGALRRREGRFALADGGTLFLDEIGELPLEMQSKLLRALQEGEVMPVGGTTPRRVDVRVVAATNRDLEAEVRAGRFREDLFYRLHVFPIRLPPLRARGGDVIHLAAAFAHRFGARLGRTIAPLSETDAARLRAYAWPGNVRELQNVIERATILATDGHLDMRRALPDVGPTESADALRGVAPSPSSATDDRILTVDELREFERANIVRALDAAGWKVAGERGAARALGMKPSTLTSRMKALGIERAEDQRAPVVANPRESPRGNS